VLSRWQCGVASKILVLMPGRSRERQWQPCRVTSSSLLSRTEDSAFVISGFGQVSHRNDLKKPDWQFILQDAGNLKEVLLNCLKSFHKESSNQSSDELALSKIKTAATTGRDTISRASTMFGLVMSGSRMLPYFMTAAPPTDPRPNVHR